VEQQGTWHGGFVKNNDLKKNIVFKQGFHLRVCSLGRPHIQGYSRALRKRIAQSAA
jgi:hypothetical protein